MADDFNVIDTGESPQPSYDESTGKMHDPELDGGKGGIREPALFEEVRHAVMKQKSERGFSDPKDLVGMEQYVQRAKKNGTSVQRAMKDYSELEDMVRTDPVTGVRHLLGRLGFNHQAVAQHLYNGTTPTGTAQAADEAQSYRAIEAFDAKHNDPMSKHLRPMAAKVLERGDKRLNGLSHAEALDRAFAIAWLELPQNRARIGPTNQLNERDRQREATNRVNKKMAQRYE